MPVYRMLIGVTAVLLGLVLLRQLSDFFVILLQALFLAAIAHTPIRWLVARRIPRGAAISLVLAGIFAALAAVAAVVGVAIRSVIAKIPEYGDRAEGLLRGLTEALLRWNIHLPSDSLSPRLNPTQVLAESGRALTGLGNMLFHEVFVFLLVVFLLIEFQQLPLRLSHLSEKPERALLNLRAMSDAMARYIGAKTVIAGASAVLSWLALVVIGVDQALLWAVLTFLLNYIPNVGPILSAVPPSLFALLEHGPRSMLFVVLAYLVIKMVFGNIVGPGLLGRRLNLSPVAILLSITLWGWVFGPTGFFLGVPITAAWKLVLERHDSTRWFALLISAHPELVPGRHADNSSTL